MAVAHAAGGNRYGIVCRGLGLVKGQGFADAHYKGAFGNFILLQFRFSRKIGDPIV
ncbi:hypothetical protein D3C74_435270 [compost metagenome]